MRNEFSDPTSPHRPLAETIDPPLSFATFLTAIERHGRLFTIGREKAMASHLSPNESAEKVRPFSVGH